MKIRRNNKTQEAQKFWKNADQSQQNVEKWPEWKKNVQLTKYSGADTESYSKGKK